MTQERKFTLDNWQNRKYVTQDGRPARIICVDAKYHTNLCDFPIVALVQDINCNELPHAYNKYGSYGAVINHALDLQDAPEEHTVWVNVYHDRGTWGRVFNSKYDVDSFAVEGRIARVKVTYKEGQMDE